MHKQEKHEIQRVLLSKTCRNLDNVALTLFSSIATWFICCFQVKFLSTWIPKYLTESVSLSFTNLIFDLLPSRFLEVKSICSVLPALREILFAFNWFDKVFKFFLPANDVWQLKFRRLISSAQWFNLKCLIARCKSLM